MAITIVHPTEVRVRCGWLDGRPRTIRLADDELPIVSIEHVREESAAYPVERGPRTIFDVQVPDARLRLTYQHRRRRWLLESLDLAALAEGLARAA